MSVPRPARPRAGRLDDYGAGPCRPELFAVLVAGGLHVLTELSLSEKAAIAYNFTVSLAFAGYLVWRVRRSVAASRAWGMRLDNLMPALRLHGMLAVVGALALLAYGWSQGGLYLPRTFWVLVFLYPIWGIAQQFALQNLVARNLADRFSGPLPLAVTAAGLFALAHYPRLDLVALTFVAGIPLTLAYRRVPNLWVLGTVHGILGSLAFYVVLREDPWRMLVELLPGG